MEAHGIGPVLHGQKGRGWRRGSDWTVPLPLAILGLLAVLSVGTSGAEPGIQPMSAEALEEADEGCFVCHEDLDDDEEEFRFPGGRTLRFEVAPGTHRASLHGRILSCSSCHEGYEDDHPVFKPESEEAYRLGRNRLCETCHDKVAQVHPASGDAPTGCVDCHAAHRDGPSEDPGRALGGRCRTCHTTAYEAFRGGKHGAGMQAENPNPDLPHCGTCHLMHATDGAKAQPVRMTATMRCIACHSDRDNIAKYGLSGNVIPTYLSDFHGKTYRHILGQEGGKGPEDEVLVCSTCHEPHAVRPPEPAEMTAICADCHEDAGVHIAGAWLGHEPPGPGNATLVWLIRTLYLVFIPVVICGLLFNILLHVIHEVRTRRAARAGAAVPAGHGDAGTSPLPSHVRRFGWIERIEHIFVMIVFSLLVVTGLPQSYPDNGPAATVLGWFGGIGATRWVHRVAGVAFALLVVFHVTRGILAVLRTRRVPDMMIGIQDFRDVYQNLVYYLGGGPAPRFGRFDFREKFEYWGMFLGSGVMIATGFFLLYPGVVSTFLPGITLTAVYVAHGFEATLAVLVVLIWHLYSVHLRSEVFPCDTSVFTGKISVERLRHEHPLEYERLLGGQTQV